MAPYTNMPDDVKKLAEDTEAAIIDRQAAPVQVPGRRRRTASTVECKGGTHLDDGQILGMNYYVKGVDDKVPGK